MTAAVKCVQDIRNDGKNKCVQGVRDGGMTTALGVLFAAREMAKLRSRYFVTGDCSQGIRRQVATVLKILAFTGIASATKAFAIKESKR